MKLLLCYLIIICICFCPTIIASPSIISINNIKIAYMNGMIKVFSLYDLKLSESEIKYIVEKESEKYIKTIYELNK